MYAREIANYITGLNFEAIPDEAKQSCKTFVLDTLGVAFRGAETKHGEIAADFAKEFAEKKESSVIRYGYKTSCLNAAFANSVMAQAIDFDDTYEAGGFHVGCVVIPTALALGEAKGISGKDVITAIVGGYDVSCRVASSIYPMLHKGIGYHITGIANCFGAAAVAGKLLKLNQNELMNAFGIAGDQASGLRQYHYDGSMLKQFHAGKAAQSGIFAALLAQRGFTGSPQIFEGEWGLGKVVAQGNFELSELIKDLGQDFMINKVSIKPWPSCRHTHTPIEAALTLCRQHNLKAGEIQRVILRVYALAFESYNKPSPETGLQALLSIQYCVATALVKGTVTVDDFWSQKGLRNVEVRESMKKIEMVADPALAKISQDKRNRPIELQIVTKDSQTFKHRVDYPLGSLENPLSKTDLTDKFRDLTSPALSKNKIERFMEIVENLEEIENAGVLIRYLQ